MVPSSPDAGASRLSFPRRAWERGAMDLRRGVLAWWSRAHVEAGVICRGRLVNGSEAGVSMKAENRHRKRKTSMIVRRSAIPLLLLIVCLVSVLQFFNAHPSPLLQRLEVPDHQSIQDRLPASIVTGIHRLRLGTVFLRAVHCAANSAFDAAISQTSPARKFESGPERLVVSMLVDSGLEVRAPPRHGLDHRFGHPWSYVGWAQALSCPPDWLV